MKKIVFGDVHGCYRELKELYNNLVAEGTLNPSEDQVIFLGDYIDRGPDSRLVVQFIRELQKNNENVIALMGNHEDMMLEFLCGYDTDSWECNGARMTVESYRDHAEEFLEDALWMEKLPLYHEDEHFIYVHAGVDASVPMDAQDRDTMLWIREPFILSRSNTEKKVIFGHTPTAYLNGGNAPVITENGNIDIDTGCVYAGRLTALVIEDDEIRTYVQIDKNLVIIKVDIRQDAA